MKAYVAARSVREGVIGLLQSCRCLYPVRHYETETLHDDACPAHAMILSARVVPSTSPMTLIAGWMDVSFDIDAPSDVVLTADRIARGHR